MLCGDWNMSFLQVILQLRAPEIPVNIAAWCPWMPRSETLPRIVSTAIFIIGPLGGCRKRFYVPVFKLRGDGVPELPQGWKLMEKVTYDDDGENRRLEGAPQYDTIDGQGYPLTSYRPQDETIVKQTRGLDVYAGYR